MTDQPVLQIINPNTTPEEIAAIVTVLAALSGGTPAPEAPRSEWANPARRVREAPATSWRSSGLPR